MRALIQRDVRDIPDIERLEQMPRLLRVLAHHSGQLTNFTQLGRGAHRFLWRPDVWGARVVRLGMTLLLDPRAMSGAAPPLVMRTAFP